ncbi:protein SHQ1 homolog [Anneissia japonica]|uniref:protein SHQ1 homolog n=1 Tax=Anneissia japonica TaxID=1529436 RepID=UPI001425545F|nr:protein SHQ1 homolog [Anneissia japonica]XP_033102353.1 protein SHQ1 homolog [Anneissia japonica]
MLTPAFEITQDAVSITVVVKARFAKVSDAEIYVDGSVFKFYSKPYFLRLNLPGALVEDGNESAKYNADEGSFTITIPKETKGEYFEGLDMLTKLLAPSGQTHTEGACIEVTGSSECSVQAGSGHMFEDDTLDDGDEEEIDWQVVQAPYLDDETVTLGNACYGFANKKSGVFRRLQEELCGIVDVKDPDNTTPAVRKKGRIEDEDEKFDEDHYLADLYEDEIVQSLLAYKPPWASEYTKLRKKQVNEVKEDEQTPFDEENIVTFSEEEKEQMRQLPRKEILHEKESDTIALLSLVDIIFAYAYNHRTTEGENTVESAWTVCKLSSSLSWLDSFSSLQEVLEANYRRSITYPLYRHWKLSNKVLIDVKKIFCLGRRRLLKCLLEIHRLLSHDDPRYILNELYITEYCLWIQSVSQRRLNSIAKALKKVKVNKEDVGLDLVELEQAAEMVMNEEQEGSSCDTEIQQYGYPEALYTHATPSSVDESVIRTAENEMERSKQLVTEIAGEMMVENIASYQMDECKNPHSEGTPSGILDSESNTDALLTGLLEDGCHIAANSTSEVIEEGERTVDITAQVVEPLSALTLVSDDTHIGQLDSKETGGSNLALMEWIGKPPVKKIEMFDSS